jgi:tetratricopeptide (TPR) repeat protein
MDGDATRGDGTRAAPGGAAIAAAPVVARARVRLARIAGRELLAGKAWWVVGAGAAAAACRPFFLRIAGDTPLWMGGARAIGLFAAGSAVAAVTLVIAGRRRGPSPVGAARAVDEALGLHEVVASGFAFERDGRSEPMALLSRRRAGEAAEGADVEGLFPLPSLRPSWRKALGVALAAVLAVGAGAYDRVLVTALVSPPTSVETTAASELEAAAAELAGPKDEASRREGPKRDRSKTDEKNARVGPALAEKAREAAQAARRGDRKGALDKLEELRSDASKQAGRASGLDAALKKMADALGASTEKAGAGEGSKRAGASGSAEESMRLLAKKMRSKEGSEGAGEESKERMLERLDRAAEEARRAAADGKDPDASEAARALSRAAAALSRGDRQAAAEALEQAASRAEAMAQARAEAAAEAMAILDMLAKSGELERAIEMAMLGKEGSGEDGERMSMGDGEDGEGKDGKGGKGGKEGAGGELRRAILARLMAMGMGGEPSGRPGDGLEPHVPDRGDARRAPLAAGGSIRAPSQVTEGERAIQAISGLGKGSDPPASYREVFPSYDAAAEEGLADERIPARRRAAVRRYFQSIRPEQP